MPSKLGKLFTVDLREIWKNEEYDFSSWLAEGENLAKLSDEIGIQIRLLEKEAEVGKYSLDILGEEEGTGRKIVIENQLEKINHDHLGKIITYAAGHDANIVIWIFKDITEEHRAAIDWLNENMGEDCLFFAIRIEAWRINDSDPAPKFQVVCKPNAWAKVVKHSAEGKGLGETDLKKLDFWTKLKSYAADKKVPLFRQTPAPQHWYNISIGSSEAHIVSSTALADYASRSRQRYVVGLFLLDWSIETKKRRRRLAASVEETVSSGRNSQRSRAQISAYFCEDIVDGRGATRSGGDSDGTSQFRDYTKALRVVGKRAAGASGGRCQASLGRERAAKDRRKSAQTDRIRYTAAIRQ